MTWFIFVGDMLVMLFMVILVIWVFMVSSDREIDNTAMIPLQDEDYESDVMSKEKPKQEEGASHG